VETLNLTYYTKDYDVFSGKILGFIDRPQFYNLFNSPGRLARKISSGNIKTLDTISKVTDFKQQRLVFNTTVDNKRVLLITAEIIEMNSISIKKEIALSMVDVHNNFIHICQEYGSTHDIY
jgi:hypothetical protein